jgi:hypothetical protein
MIAATTTGAGLYPSSIVAGPGDPYMVVQPTPQFKNFLGAAQRSGQQVLTGIQGFFTAASNEADTLATGSPIDVQGGGGITLGISAPRTTTNAWLWVLLIVLGIIFLGRGISK